MAKRKWNSRAEKSRAWRAANPELQRKYARDYYQRNKEKEKARHQEWAAANREHLNEYRRRNVEKAREAVRKSRIKYLDKRRAKAHEWYLANRESKLESERIYHLAHPEKKRATTKAWNQKWRDEHPEEYRRQLEVLHQQWWATHPEEIRAMRRNRRSREQQAPGRHTADDIRTLFKAQSGLCAACHKALITTGKGKYHVDHIVPLKPRKGDPAGTNDPSNLQLLCPTCNLCKQNLSPAKWAERLKRLSS